MESLPLYLKSYLSAPSHSVFFAENSDSFSSVILSPASAKHARNNMDTNGKKMLFILAFSLYINYCFSGKVLKK